MKYYGVYCTFEGVMLANNDIEARRRIESIISDAFENSNNLIQITRRLVVVGGSASVALKNGEVP